MTLSAKYQAFLASPAAGALAESATLHYITTLTSIHDAAPIMRHLAVQQKLLTKKAEKVISTIEGGNGLAIELETVIEFKSGGGAFLPGLDDNFVADRTVTFPVVHMVHFDQAQKITQIRQSWDQGSLLKQIDVIGARARNWPLRDGKDQARLIASSSAAVSQPQPESAVSSRRSTASRGADEVSVKGRPVSSRSSASNAMNDPYATLNLFQSRDTNARDTESVFSEPTHSRAQSAKPPPRELSELFVDENEAPATPSVAGDSPAKDNIPKKGGGGKNFKRNRLFDQEEEVPTPMSVRTNAKKYDHFEFGNGEDEVTPKVKDQGRANNKAKHQSSWDFEDFVTPQKPGTKVLGQAIRHFGWSDDEVSLLFRTEVLDEGSPVRREVVHKARPDAEAHFQFVDEGTPAADRKAHTTSKGRQHNKGLGLYQDHILHSTEDAEDAEEQAARGDSKRVLGDVTTAVKNENRKKDFGSQWEMLDDSPAVPKTTNGSAKPAPADRKNLVKGNTSSWDFYDNSPETSKKENVDNNARGIKTSGNGMGGRKGTGRSWAIGDSDDESVPQPKGNANNNRTETKNFWDF
ncbi:hypothetical protein P154DRAFT_436900 [Amniculicola lignicola CBS 123094]|uniref:NTF2-like protein n=1 Tax=Amniculicola lignicola CBS 123094 TaxID=1392246 RepID=A0A6A5WPB7_9PLEO|nr:hypothetical protein P154DRAFT_436900 [Amniculicola lignicola CBS 123094]